MIDIRQLRYAVATADARSFARAAATLRVKQITLSRRVQQLEDSLGVKLFERSTRGAEVTESGRVFIERARRIVTDIENLQTSGRNVSYGLQGKIAVGFCSSLMIGNLRSTFADYWLRFPDVQTDAVEGSPDRLLQCLQSQAIDVAIAPNGLNISGIRSRALWSERLHVALPVDAEILQEDRVYWHSLRKEVFVLPNGLLGPIIANIIAARLTEQGCRPQIIFQDTSVENIISMIPSKRFITITTEASQGVMWPGIELREVYDGVGPARLEFALYWREENENPALKRFLELLDERYPR